MLDTEEINRVARKAASAALNGRGVSRVYSRLTRDSGGNDAVGVTVVFKSGIVNKLHEDAALDVITRIGRDLQNSGEDRLAIVSFSTEEEERAERADTES
jgi:hypothetical protein